MNNWPIKKLGDVANFLDSQRKPVTKKDRIHGPYPYYGANGQQDSVADYIFSEELVLLAEDGGNFGSKTRPVAYRVSGKCWINNHAHVLQSKKEIMDVDFLGYQLMFYDVTPYITGSTRAKLNKSDASKIAVLVPPLKIQQKIVERLDAIRKAQELNDLQISKIQELFGSVVSNSILNKDFPTKGLGDIAEIISGQSPRSINYNKNGDGWPLYQGKRDFGSMFTADPEVWTTEKTKMVKRFDILISVRAPVGPVNLANCEMNIGRGLAAIRPWEDVDYMFLFYFLQAQEENIAKLGSGSTFQSINRNELQNLKIPIPPIKEQQKIVEKLNAVQDYKKSLLKQKDLLKELFDSVLNKLMTPIP